jgi:hypothetical protein
MIKELEALGPEDRERLVRVNRQVLFFGACALGAMFSMSLPLPWPALGVVLLVLAVVLAIRGLVTANGLPLASGASLYLGLGLGMCAMFALYAVGLAATWGEQWDYQQCVTQSQTVQGRDACTSQYKQDTQNMFSDLFQRGS